MAYEADVLVDRRRLKRRVFVWRSVAILMVVALVAAAVGRFTAFGNGEYVARLSVSGIIVNDIRRLELVDRLAEDSDAEAVILRIDSPGGTVVGGEALFKALNRLSEKKPVVAVMDEVGTSAAYMIALAANRIYAHEGTITGSIGVVLQATEITDLLDKIGISSEAIKSGPLKAEPNPLEEMTPEVRRATQTLVDDLFRMFLGMVMERRKIPEDDATALADGRVFTGRMAVENGLIDEIGGERDALDWLNREYKIDRNIRVRDVRIDRGFQEWFGYMDQLAQKIVFSERLTLDGLISVWHPSLK